MKKIISLLIVILILCSCASTRVYACYYCVDGSKTQEELDKDIKYWWQGHVPADNSLITGKAGSDTIGSGACSHFAMTYTLVKMGIFNPANGDTPITHIQNARNKNAFLVDWGYFDFNRVSELYPDVSYEGRDDNVSGMSASDGLTYVKGKMSEGYYVVAIVYGGPTSGHCIFFDGINEDGSISVGDSAFEGITWEEIYGSYNMCFSYLELLKCKGKDFNSQPSIYDSNALRGVTSKEIIDYKALVKEWDLKGMPSKSNLSGSVIKPVIPTVKSLTQEELNNLSAIKEIKNAEELSYFDIAKTIISFIGLLLLVYALLLLIAYIFDRVNSFLNISLVSLLTLGHMKVVQPDDYSELDSEAKKKKGYITFVKLLIIIITLLVLGSLMLSGYISYWIYSIIQGVSGVL